ncbi:MAG: hypothetical protein AABX13_01890 [Nanoarchaeota archaeon]
MQEISNRTIVTLLTIVLLVTVVGTIVGVSKVHQLVGVYDVLTGAPSFSFAETNITVSAITSLSLAGGNGTAMSFGTGYVNQTCQACQVDSNAVISSLYLNGSTVSSNNCCVSFSFPSSGFLLENTGNVNLSVGYTCSGNCTHNTFLGGVRNTTTSGMEIKVTPNSVASQGGEEAASDTAPSCQGGGTTIRDSSWNITNSSAYSVCPGTSNNFQNGNCTGFPAQTYVAFSSYGHYLCGNSSSYPLGFENSRDAAVVDINLSILTDSFATGGRSSFRITFNGTSSG